MSKRWHPYIWSTARRHAALLPTWYDAEDLAQDLTLMLWEDGSLDEVGTFGLKYQVVNILRQLYGRTFYKKRERSIEELSVYMEEWGKCDLDIEGWVDREKVKRWVQSLPPRSRQILIDKTCVKQREVGYKHELTEGRISQIVKDIQQSFINAEV